MKFIPPSFNIVNFTHHIVTNIYEAARICYQTERPADIDTFVKAIIKKGHHSVLEHGAITVDIICDRGVSHELVRHRIAAYSQESTRYCNYSKGRFDSDLTFIIPPFFHQAEPFKGAYQKYNIWVDAMQHAEWSYLKLVELGARPEEARSVLPNSLKTQIRVTANPREWRHIFSLRCSKAAHPQMREIMIPMLDEFSILWPALFEDIRDNL